MSIDFFGGGGGGSTFSSIKIADTDSSNYLTIDWNENDTSDRTLYFLVGGANRSITLSGNPTLGDWFDQEVKTTSESSFKTVTFGTVYANGNSGASKTIDWGNGQKQTITLTDAPCVFTFTAPAGTGNFLLVITQAAGGAKTATWPGTVKWPNNGAAPTLSTGAGEIDIVSFFYDGTTYYGSYSLDFA